MIQFKPHFINVDKNPNDFYNQHIHLPFINQRHLSLDQKQDINQGLGVGFGLGLSIKKIQSQQQVPVKVNSQLGPKNMSFNKPSNLLNNQQLIIPEEYKGNVSLRSITNQDQSNSEIQCDVSPMQQKIIPEVKEKKQYVIKKFKKVGRPSSQIIKPLKRDDNKLEKLFNQLYSSEIEIVEFKNDYDNQQDNSFTIMDYISKSQKVVDFQEHDQETQLLEQFKQEQEKQYNEYLDKIQYYKQLDIEADERRQEVIEQRAQQKAEQAAEDAKQNKKKKENPFTCNLIR